MLRWALLMRRSEFKLGCVDLLQVIVEDLQFIAIQSSPKVRCRVSRSSRQVERCMSSE